MKDYPSCGARFQMYLNSKILLNFYSYPFTISVYYYITKSINKKKELIYDTQQYHRFYRNIYILQKSWKYKYVHVKDKL